MSRTPLMTITYLMRDKSACSSAVTITVLTEVPSSVGLSCRILFNVVALVDFILIGLILYNMGDTYGRYATMNKNKCNAEIWIFPGKHARSQSRVSDFSKIQG